MKPLDKLGRREREIVEERRTSVAGEQRLIHFDELHEPTLRAFLDRLLPGVPAHVDLAAFVDRHLEEPLGRGDRKDGMPPTAELIRQSIDAFTRERFTELTGAEQGNVIGRLRHGDLGAEAKEFIDRLLDKALMGYLAHPDTWGRIGFNGPAYPQGYAWIDVEEVAARHDRKPGWDKL
ncbi:MAG: gluconate 2-dehydrogenase subunit 3 family protein [Actinomycetota bacterium]|nr:gluconate 2-dehydrogenase subunit 3 family protein [Actinomycetota bacterium]